MNKQKLWQKYLKKPSQENAKAIVEANLPLLYHIAIKYYNKNHPTWIEVDDLVAEGYLVALRCVKYFDPAKGNQFSTYCGKSLWLHFNDLYKVQMSYHKSTKIKDVKYNKTVPLIDIDHPTYMEDRDDIIDLEIALRNANLTGQMKSLIKMVFYDGKLLREAGEDYGITRQRVRQIIIVGLNKLRKAMGVKNSNKLGLIKIEGI